MDKSLSIFPRSPWEHLKGNLHKPVRDKSYALLVGLGLILFPIHNSDLTQLVTSQSGEVLFFLPALGAFLWIVPSLLYATRKGNVNLGERYIYIPLLVLVTAISLSGLNNDTLVTKISPTLMGISLFSLYLVGRSLGESIFRIFIPFIIIEAVGIYIDAILHPGVRVSGLLGTNYDVAIGVLILGTAIGACKGQWWLLILVLPALFLTGAEEGLFGGAIMGSLLVARRDFDKRILLPIGALLFTVVLSTSFGITQSLYSPTIEKIAAMKKIVEEKSRDTVVGSVLDEVIPNRLTASLEEVIQEKVEERLEEPTEELNDIAPQMLWQITTGDRLDKLWPAIQDTRPLGHGYKGTLVYRGIPHNTPVLVLYQVGPAGALSWLFITFTLLYKTRRKYAWTAILALSVFDHFLWTQIFPWWWVLVGTSSIVTGTDKLFRGTHEKVSFALPKLWRRG